VRVVVVVVAAAAADAWRYEGAVGQLSGWLAPAGAWSKRHAGCSQRSTNGFAVDTKVLTDSSE
jgi:hypothetical protein